MHQVLNGNCIEVLRGLADNSVDSIVTDPPYGLSQQGTDDIVECLTAWMRGEPYTPKKRGFMGKDWDGWVPGPDVWRECLRVLKPGGHLLAFAGTRTQDLMTIGLRLAGFEIRDMLAWVYGSGFPKSLDVSKAIDKQRYNREDVLKVTKWIRAVRDAAGITNRDIDAAFGFSGMAGHWTSAKLQPAIPTLEHVPTLLDVLGLTLDDVPEEIKRLLWDLNGRKGQPGENWWKREVVGQDTKARSTSGKSALPTIGGSTVYESWDITAPATDAARQWDGWGTALKPALEPITLARKPLGGTVAANVLEHGTGALNIDGCRVRHEVVGWGGGQGCRPDPTQSKGRNYRMAAGEARPVTGRWPANLVHDGSEEVLALFPQTGPSKSGGKAGWQDRYVGGTYTPIDRTGYDEPAGSAARFFYCAKASRRERDAGLDESTAAMRNDGRQTDIDNPYQRGKVLRNHHPTVKPVALMRWLCRLVTPPGGVVLDPFAGSGSTGVAAVAEGFSSVLIEREPEYVEIIRRRLAHAQGEMGA